MKPSSSAGNGGKEVADRFRAALRVLQHPPVAEPVEFGDLGARALRGPAGQRAPSALAEPVGGGDDRQARAWRRRVPGRARVRPWPAARRSGTAPGSQRAISGPCGRGDLQPPRRGGSPDRPIRCAILPGSRRTAARRPARPPPGSARPARGRARRSPGRTARARPTPSCAAGPGRCMATLTTWPPPQSWPIRCTGSPSLVSSSISQSRYSVTVAPKPVGHRCAEAGRREPQHVAAAEFGEQRSPDRIALRVAVHENNGHCVPLGSRVSASSRTASSTWSTCGLSQSVTISHSLRALISRSAPTGPRQARRS